MRNFFDNLFGKKAQVKVPRTHAKAAAARSSDEALPVSSRKLLLWHLCFTQKPRTDEDEAGHAVGREVVDGTKSER